MAETKGIPGWLSSLLIGLGVGVVIIIGGTEYKIWRHGRESGKLPTAD